MIVSDENKILANYLRLNLGKSPKISNFLDEVKVKNFDIYSLSDIPVNRVNTYVTLGLSDISIGLEVDSVPLSVKLIFALVTSYKYAANIIASCAFIIINADITSGPRRIILRIVELYYKESYLTDVFLYPPFYGVLKLRILLRRRWLVYRSFRYRSGTRLC